MMELVPFRPEHLLALTPPVAAPCDILRFSRTYQPSGPAWTGFAAGRPIGCGGFRHVGAVGRGWVILSHPVRVAAVHRAVRRAIQDELAGGAVRQIEARVLEEWDGACRWLERLGFQAVGRDGEFRVYRK